MSASVPTAKSWTFAESVLKALGLDVRILLRLHCRPCQGRQARTEWPTDLSEDRESSKVPSTSDCAFAGVSATVSRKLLNARLATISIILEAAVVTSWNQTQSHC